MTVASSALVTQRRTPFASNGPIGAGAVRTQERILDAAVRVFREDGYHDATVARIAKLAGCSRIAFYQYFANKEEVFRHLAEQVARDVGASTELVDPITADAEGWAALRAWVGRYAEIHQRYEPVFHAYESDPALAAIAGQTGEETLTRILARLPARRLRPVVTVLLEMMNHTLDVNGVLGAYPRPLVEQAITDVMHRTLFGLQPGVNVHEPETEADLPSGTPWWTSTDDPPESEVREALLTAGREVFVERGYHRARVDDVVGAAGLSHGAFYRYFRNKDELARVLTAEAVQGVGELVEDLPEPDDLRPWLQRYHAAHRDEAGMLQVWLDAALQAPSLRAESATLLGWGCRRMAHHLERRGFGDPCLDGVVLVALLGIFGARPRPATEVEATAVIIERGLLGVS